MANLGGMFSESWHRVARVRAALRPTVHVRRQWFHGEWWYVLHDSFNNTFFRLRPTDWAFVGRLGLDRTVDDVWRQTTEADPDEAPGQGDALSLLSQLNNSNLLQFAVSGDIAKVRDRQIRQRRKTFLATLTGLLYLRLPLFDPDALLGRLGGFSALVFSRLGALLWALVVGAALKVVVDHFEDISHQGGDVIAPGNMALLYLATVVVKTIHEYGHAAACKHFGGEVHTVGVMFMLLAPLPYVDATASWNLRRRRERAIVGAAGMYTEVFVAALATILWAHAPPGVVRSLAYDMMFAASVSTVLFNINPLLRFDGYYILLDIIGQANLFTRAQAALHGVAERLLFGIGGAPVEGQVLRLAAFGAAAATYRVMVTVGIIVFVSESYLLLGTIMAGILLLSWLPGPALRLIRYLATSPRLQRRRRRAVGTVLGLVGSGLLIVLVPFPHTVRAPGIVEAAAYQELLTASAGTVVEVLAGPGHPVTRGQVLLRLSNPDLGFDIAEAEARLEALTVARMQAESQEGIDLDPVLKHMAAVRSSLDQLREARDGLKVRAPRDGIWVVRSDVVAIGQWMQRGTSLGMVATPGRLRFAAVASQEEIGGLFDSVTRTVQVRIHGQGGGPTVRVVGHHVIPFQRETLPSAALGWSGGGDVAINASDREGRRSSEPFFLIHADLETIVGRPALHGQTGEMRITLDPQPLWQQMATRVRQFFQKRYLSS